MSVYLYACQVHEPSSTAGPDRHVDTCQSHSTADRTTIDADGRKAGGDYTYP